jgi:hypothetical protein
MIIDSDEANILIPISKKGASQITSLAISLSWMSLFTSGQTWYNKFGFREPEFVANSEAINEFIRQPISAVVSEKIMEKISAYSIGNDSSSVKDIFSDILMRIKAISVATHKTKSGIASAADIVELNVYDDLMHHCIKIFKKNAPRSFFTKFKQIPFTDDAGVGKKKKKTKKSKKTNYKKTSYKTYKSKKNKKLKKKIN